MSKLLIDFLQSIQRQLLRPLAEKSALQFQNLLLLFTVVTTTFPFISDGGDKYFLSLSDTSFPPLVTSVSITFLLLPSLSLSHSI
jgi:hypothetical protein